jgi:hypothetical protein
MKAMNLIAPFVILLLLCSFFSLRANALYTLKLSVVTDKPVYRLEYTFLSTVHIGGNLTLDGAPVSDGLVAFTVFQGTIGNYIRPILFRTLTTGSVPSQNWSLNIVSVDIGEWNGSAFEPKTTFNQPSTPLEPGPAFNITFRNVDYKAWAYLTLTVFDAAKVPIATRIMILQDVSANSTSSVITDSISLEHWVTLGTATVYVNAFDNVPPYVYFPYCPEASAQFEIVSDGGGLLCQANSNTFDEQIFSINGNYNLTFRVDYHIALPNYSPWGNYTVKVSSVYQGQQAVNSYTFWMKIPGDLNGDGICSIKDATLIGLYWMQTVPPADPVADYNGDGVVSIKDATIIGLYWMAREQR